VIVLAVVYYLLFWLLESSMVLFVFLLVPVAVVPVAVVRLEEIEIGGPLVV
jgi:hypothetical protein